MNWMIITIIVLSVMLLLALGYIYVMHGRRSLLKAAGAATMIGLVGTAGVVVVNPGVVSPDLIGYNTTSTQKWNTMTVCDTWTIPVNVTTAIYHYYNETYYANDTWHNRTVYNYTEYVTEEVQQEQKDCTDYFNINGEIINPEAKGWACKDRKSYIECDSVLDGDGNGVCHPNGGETCYRFNITNTEETYKNSRPDWVSTKIDERRKLK